MSHFKLALLLGMTVALGPLALDAYLPAFPEIAASLGVAHSEVGLTLSAYVMTLGLAQLVGGPLSDRYGRRVILFTGLAIFALAGLLVATADSLSEMILWRVLQGVGGAFCAVSVPAIVRDEVGGQDAARLFGLIGLIMFIAPAIAPALGAVMLAVGDWQWIFLLLAGYALVLVLVLQLALFSRLEPRPRSQTPVKTLVTNYWLVLCHKTTLRFVGIQVFCFSSMLLFITHASYIYQEVHGLSNHLFALFFAANIAMMAVFNIINRPLLKHFTSVVLLRSQVIFQFLALSSLVMTVWLNGPFWLLVVSLVLASGSQGGIVPNNMANALEFFPRLGGTSAALLGASQFTLSGMISALSAAFWGDSLLLIVLSMLVCSLGALLLALKAPAAVAREKQAIANRA